MQRCSVMSTPASRLDTSYSPSGTYQITLRVGAPDRLGGVIGVKEEIARALELYTALRGAVIVRVERI